MTNSTEKPKTKGKEELDAALERARIAREEYLKKHPLPPKKLEEEFGKEVAARMRREAEINARKDGKID